MTVALVVAALGVWLWWRLDLRWRPHLIVRHQTEIAKSLDSAGWVSPHLPGPRLYVVMWRDCPACAAFDAQALPKLQAAGVDTRLILFARADANGLVRSTPAERTTVAALWLSRDWALAGRWLATPSAGWSAPGLPPADGDSARTAVVEAGRKSIGDLEPLLQSNGIALKFPILVWWTRAGAMHGCGCDDPRAWARAEKELGA